MGQEESFDSFNLGIQFHFGDFPNFESFKKRIIEIKQAKYLALNSKEVPFLSLPKIINILIIENINCEDLKQLIINVKQTIIKNAS